MEKYIFPIVLYNKRLVPGKFKLADNALLRRISSTERKKFWGIESIKWSKNAPDRVGGLIVPYEYKMLNSPRNKPILPPHPQFDFFDNFYSEFICSEYVVELSSNDIRKTVNNINLCFSLLRPTSTGLYIGFKYPSRMTRGTTCNPFSGKFDYQNWTKSNLETIKDIYVKLNKSDKNKEIINLNRLSELYRLAISSEVNIDIAFILMTTCLEILYLKDNKELTFKLAAYVSRTLFSNRNILSKKGFYRFDKGMSALDIFNRVKKIYAIRSGIIHSGKADSVSTEKFGILVEIVRLSILLFMYSPDVFKPEKLRQSLIDGK